MAFFARPNLDDTQFKQLPDSVLSLSGVTHIDNVTGFTLMDDFNNQIPIVVTGATNDYVLTYDCLTDPLNPSIRLKCSASAGAFNYSGASPTTCTVGGLVSGTPIAGQPINTILQSILVPTLNPILTPNSITMSLLPSSPLIYEVGRSLALTLSITYGLGSVCPAYCGGTSVRTCAATGYSYVNIDGSSYAGASSSCLLPPKPVADGTNTVTGVAYYAAGTAPLKSDGTPMTGCTCSAGNLSINKSITGTYPWYWGKITCAAPAGVGRPSAACIKHEITGNTCGGLNTGNKVVCTSTGTICTTFNTTDNDYLWFATPVASTTKCKWWVSDFNCGAIGGVVSAAGNLFPAPDTITGVTSVGTGSWSGQCYKVYVSNKQTCSTVLMQLRNS